MRRDYLADRANGYILARAQCRKLLREHFPLEYLKHDRISSNRSERNKELFYLDYNLINQLWKDANK